MIDYPYEPATWLPYLALVVEFVRVVAWPVAAAAAVVVLRQPVLSLIPRISTLRAPGIEVNIESAKERQIAKTHSSEHESVIQESGRVVRNLPRTEAIQQVEAKIRELLERFPQAEREDLLVNALAADRLERHFALAYINIFGSQIRALQLANERGGFISRAEAEKEFESLKQYTEPLKDWTLDRYTAFLESNEFVRRTPEGFQLTNFGRDFIGFLIRSGLPTSKPL